MTRRRTCRLCEGALRVIRLASGRLFLPARRRVRTLAGALWVALPGPGPYRLDRIDLVALNDTAPGRERPFRLPDAVAEHVLWELWEKANEAAWAAGEAAS